jgi:hypothetical protein
LNFPAIDITKGAFCQKISGRSLAIKHQQNQVIRSGCRGWIGTSWREGTFDVIAFVPFPHPPLLNANQPKLVIIGARRKLKKSVARTHRRIG